MEIRTLRSSDLEQVERIQGQASEAAQWPVADYLQYESYVCVEENRVLGFATIQRLGAGEAELLNIAVAVEGRRRGVGRMLLKRIMEQDVTVIHLEVRASNVAAQGLYISTGFRVVGCRKGYYAPHRIEDEAREDAVVMKYEKW